MRRATMVLIVVAACGDNLSPPDASPHPGFPLSGPHAVACGDCHVLGANPATEVRCSSGPCHTRNMVNPRHRGIARYMWSDAVPSFCLSCHPDGRIHD
jgi:hypothetical protein